MAETTKTGAVDFLRDAWVQVQKVTWPSRDELKESTGVIVAFVLAVALVIFGMDYVIRAVLQLITSLFTG